MVWDLYACLPGVHQRKITKPRLQEAGIQCSFETLRNKYYYMPHVVQLSHLECGKTALLIQVERSNYLPLVGLDEHRFKSDCGQLL